MELFHVIDDAAVILRSRGVFRQAKVYRRGTSLYAAHGNGFIRLLAQPNTSHPNVSWEETDVDWKPGRLGAPTVNVKLSVAS